MRQVSSATDKVLTAACAAHTCVVLWAAITADWRERSADDRAQQLEVRNELLEHLDAATVLATKLVADEMWRQAH